MRATSTAEIVRSYFSAFQSQDRQAIEALLADDFTFTSPLDDRIGRAKYFERCWPYSELHRTFRIMNLLENGAEAFVRYECELVDHGTFRNTEYFRVEAGRIREICVYFGGDTAHPAGNGESQVRAVLEGWARAIRDKDVAGCLANHAPDVVTFDAIKPLQRAGTAGVDERVREWFAIYDGPIGYETRDLRITAGDDVAFSRSLNRVSGRLLDGKRVDMWLRQTCCFRNVHGKWLATHTHVSVPFDGDTGKAALDLEP
jgi:ketosteroid isomerase-like protein